LLRINAHCHASLPHDKLFAFYALASDVRNGNLSIDYNMSIEDVNREVTLHVLAQEKHLWCLEVDCGLWNSTKKIQSSHERQEMSGSTRRLPSWIRNWEKVGPHGRISSVDSSDTADPFTAAGMTVFTPQESEFRDALVVEGHIADIIVEVGFKHAYTTTFDADSLFYVRCKKTLERLSGTKQYPSKELYDAAFVRTIRPNICFRRRGDMTARESQWWVAHISNLDYPIDKEDHFDYLDIPNLHSEHKEFGVGQKVAIAEAGFMALVPDTTCVGDEVSLLKGGNVPFILRGEERGAWSLVGASHVDGIMHGEAFEEGECRRILLR
jgi:hypothetical protein